MQVTFEQLPQAVTQLCEDMAFVKELLLKKELPLPVADELLTVDQAAEFLRLSKPTVYGLISKGELPVMKRSKRCYFSKAELVEYLKQGRKKTTSEIEAEAETPVRRKGR